jgi:phage gp29-like protein
MSKKKQNPKWRAGMITAAGNRPLPGQTRPATIILTQPKRFGVDIADYMQAIRGAENVDYNNRSKLYDLYADILLDTHLTCVLEKRRNALLCSDIEFQRDGKPDPVVGEQIHSPWFNRLVSDIIDAKFWGFTLCQFFKDGDWVDYNLIPRKHVDPLRRLILRRQTDITGIDWDQYPDLLFVGDPTDLGLLAKAAPWVIYKRNTTGDWSQFSEVFGMPIQEYTYDTDDDDSRRRAIDDASNAGSLAVFVHGKDTALNLIEAGNKTGSADVYERLCERCNNEISKLILGNTLTTESSDKGTQALGTVHKKVEDKVTQSDRLYLLNVLNYDMTDIFLRMGINTAGGRFCYPEQKDIDPTTKASIVANLHANFGLPVDDEFLYEEFGISKPANYNALKQQEQQRRQEQRQQQLQQFGQQSQDNNPNNEPKDEPKEAPNAPQDKPQPKRPKNAFRDFFNRFFRPAPERSGAHLEW